MESGDDLFPEQELCSLSRATLAHLCGFDGSLGFCCLWTGAGLVLWPRLSREEPEGLVDSLALTKRSAYGRMRRRRLEADGDALEMLSIGGQAYLQATTVVHCGCPRVRGRGHWTDGNADGESTDLEPSAEEVIRVWLPWSCGRGKNVDQS